LIDFKDIYTAKQSGHHTDLIQSCRDTGLINYMVSDKGLALETTHGWVT